MTGVCSNLLIHLLNDDCFLSPSSWCWCFQPRILLHHHSDFLHCNRRWYLSHLLLFLWIHRVWNLYYVIIQSISNDILSAIAAISYYFMSSRERFAGTFPFAMLFQIWCLEIHVGSISGQFKLISLIEELVLGSWLLIFMNKLLDNPSAHFLFPLYGWFCKEYIYILIPSTASPICGKSARSNAMF